MSIVVTGASGMLGSAVVRELLEQGEKVVALVRDRAKATNVLPASRALTVLTGDVTDPAHWDSVLPGADGVVHTAAYFREYYTPAHQGAEADRQMFRTNVLAVRELLEAAHRHGVGCVVHVSSTSVLAGDQQHPVDETSRFRPKPNGYAASKIAAERTVRAHAGVRVPQILPAWMWGPRDAGPTSAGRLLLGIARSQLRALPAAGTHIVDARDVALACCRALESGSHAQRYVVAGRWTPLREVAEIVARDCQVPVPRQVPVRLAVAVAILL
ncbi:MAG: hypothetical protein CSB46_03385 [Micrococcales bacterium]|nr:MAG: hypothetical protein CSB46_03385 [Micrococcales bacterium]